MMDKTAVVVRVDGKLMAELTRSEACARCGACQHGRQESLRYPLPDGDYREGDEVVIRLPDANAFGASALAYGIPIACLLLGLALGMVLGLPDLAQAALGLSALAVSFFALKALEPRLKRSGRYEPKFCNDQDKRGEY